MKKLLPSLWGNNNKSPQSRKGRIGVDFDQRKLFEEDGISLSVLDEFIVDCGGELVLSNLSTREVHERYVHPRTIAAQSSYATIINNRNYNGDWAASNGPPPVFISHSWQANFLDVVNAIKLYFKSHTPVYIWFDLICFNEHQTEINSGRQGYNWFASTIKSGIESVGKTLLVMTNTTLSLANSPLRRTWCLFEVYCTIETKCSLEIITSSAEQVKLTKAVECDFAALNKELLAIRFEKSVSSLKADSDAMYGVIERSIGFDGVNSMIMEQVRQWLLHFIQTLATSTAPISSTRKSSSSSSSAAADNATAETLHAAYVHALGDIQCSRVGTWKRKSCSGLHYIFGACIWAMITWIRYPHCICYVCVCITKIGWTKRSQI
jgi:hypothetical protein